MAENTLYPEPVATRTGSKVSWNYYEDKATAEVCSIAAKKEGGRLTYQGYDFGFCCPGSVVLVREGEHVGKYEVCLP